ncbi:MAG: chorismate synthase, partial [Candidatus Gastranaerophilaceae bacterium]
MTFRYLTSGESHGKCLTAIIEGVPSGFEISEDFINKHLARRQVGYGRGGRMQIEKDTVEIKSGIRFGITTGAPICLEIKNKDWENWQISMSTKPVDINNEEVQKIILETKITKVRPGHADLAGALKYNHSDIRNILERSSARETAARVAVGAVAMAILEKFQIEIFSHVTCIGSAKLELLNPVNLLERKDKAEKSNLRCV